MNLQQLFSDMSIELLYGKMAILTDTSSPSSFSSTTTVQPAAPNFFSWKGREQCTYYWDEVEKNHVISFISWNIRFNSFLL